MTPEEFYHKMVNLTFQHMKVNGDVRKDALRDDMDRLMCMLLRELGYGKGIDIYEDYIDTRRN